MTIPASILEFHERIRDLSSPPVKLLLGSYAALIGLGASVLFLLPMRVAFVLLTPAASGFLWWAVTQAPQSFQLASLRLERVAAKSSSRVAPTGDRSTKWRFALARSLLTPQWALFTGLLLLQSDLGN